MFGEIPLLSLYSTALSNIIVPFFGRDQLERVSGSPLPLIATLTIRVSIEPDILLKGGGGDKSRARSSWSLPFGGAMTLDRALQTGAIKGDQRL